MTRVRLVLIGAGHAHAEVLAHFARLNASGSLSSCRDIELIIISPHRLAPYSGMIPGWLAGRYRWDECCVDFAALAARAGARFIETEVLGLEAGARRFNLASGEQLVADVASLNIGSTVAAPPSSDNGPLIIPMRPLAALRARVENFTRDCRRGPVAMVAVGGGAAGVESILAMQRRHASAAIASHATLVTRTRRILPSLASSVASRAEAVLRRSGIELQTDFDVSEVDTGGLRAVDGRHVRADVILWATGGTAHDWPRESGLDVDPGGFIRVDAQLRSVSHQWLHAVGDCAAFGATGVPKSGVFSVRMGPILSHNLEAAVRAMVNVHHADPGHAQSGYAQSDHQDFRRYRPQRRHLVLLNSADGTAIASWGPLAIEGAWVWRWKDHIDRSFVRRYTA